MNHVDGDRSVKDNTDSMIIRRREKRDYGETRFPFVRDISRAMGWGTGVMHKHGRRWEEIHRSDFAKREKDIIKNCISEYFIG